jgi:hypothetical protein
MVEIASEMDGVDELRRLEWTLRRLRKGNTFTTWYWCLKRCFPASDRTISRYLGVDQNDFSRWKLGKRTPRSCVIQLVTFLCLLKVGIRLSDDDLIHLSYTTAAQLAKIIDAHLPPAPASETKVDTKPRGRPKKAKSPAK